MPAKGGGAASLRRPYPPAHGPKENLRLRTDGTVWYRGGNDAARRLPDKRAPGPRVEKIERPRRLGLTLLDYFFLFSYS